jgi:hypothetical protein
MKMPFGQKHNFWLNSFDSILNDVIPSQSTDCYITLSVSKWESFQIINIYTKSN